MLLLKTQTRRISTSSTNSTNIMMRAAFALLSCRSAVADAVLNVVFLVSDDMRPELGAYGASHMHTPSLDALAREGSLFQRTYVAVSLCMPSRTAFLTSRRPDTTRNYQIAEQYWRANPLSPNATTLPQHFKDSGYRTVGMGKIFHNCGFPWSPGPNDDAFSWSNETTLSPPSLPYFDFDNWTNTGNSVSFGSFDVPDNNMQVLARPPMPCCGHCCSRCGRCCRCCC